MESQTNGEALRLGEILVARGRCALDDITAALAEQFQMEMVNIDGLDIPREVIDIVPEQLCRENHMMPIGIVDGVLAVALSNPLNLQALDELRFLLNMSVDPVLATRESIDAAIARYFAKDNLRDEMIVISNTRSIMLIPKVLAANPRR